MIFKACNHHNRYMPKSAMFYYIFLEGLKLIGFKLKNFVSDNTRKKRLAATQKKSQKNEFSEIIIKLRVATFKVTNIDPNDF